MNFLNCKLNSIYSNFRFTYPNSFSFQTKTFALSTAIFAGLLLNGKSRTYLCRTVKQITSSIPLFKTLFSQNTLYSQIRDKIDRNFPEGLDEAIGKLSPEEALQLVLQSGKHGIVIPENEQLKKATDRIIRTFDPNTSFQNQTPVEKRARLIYHLASRLSVLVFDITGSFFDVPSLIYKIQSYPKNLASIVFAFSLPVSFHYLWKTLRPVLESVFGDLEVFEQTHRSKFALLALFTTVATYTFMKGEKAKSIVDHGEKLRFNQFAHMHLDTIPSFKSKIEEVLPSIRTEMGTPGSSIFLWHEDHADGSLRYFLTTLSEVAQTGRGDFNEQMFHYWEVDLNSVTAGCDTLQAVRYEWNKLINQASRAGNPYLFIPNFHSIYHELHKEDHGENQNSNGGVESKEHFLAQMIMDDVKEKKIRLITAGNRKAEENITHFAPYSTFFSRIQVPYIEPEQMAEVMKRVYCPSDRWDAVSIDDHVIEEMIKMGKRFKLGPSLPEEFHVHILDTFRGIGDFRQVQPLLEDPTKYDWFEMDDLLFIVEKYQLSFDENEQVFLSQLQKDFQSGGQEILDQAGNIKQEKRKDFLAFLRKAQQKLKETHSENLSIWNAIKEGSGRKLNAYRSLKDRLLEKWWAYRQKKQSVDIPHINEVAKKLHLLEKCFIPHLQEMIAKEKKKLKGFETTASYNEIFERLQRHEKTLLGPPVARERRMLQHLPMMLNEKIMERPEVVQEICKQIMEWRLRSSENDRKRTGPVFVFAGPPGTGKSTAAQEIAAALQLTHGIVKASLRDNHRAWPIPNFYKKGQSKIEEKMFSEIQEFIIDKKTCVVVLEEFDIIEDTDAIKQILELIGDAPMKVNRSNISFVRNEYDNPTGEEVDRRNVIFIFNCNFFDLKWKGQYQTDRKSVEEHIKKKYEEAFRSRIWATIPFSQLSERSLHVYIDQYILDATNSYSAYLGKVEVDNTLKEHLILKAKESNHLRVLDRMVSETISQNLLKHLQTLPSSPKPWKATLSYDNGSVRLTVK